MIGSGPAGQRVALRAARDCRRVALIEQRQVLGGGCLHTSTIPSKTLREAVLYFTGHRLHSVYGFSYRLKDCITMDDLTFRVQHVIRLELGTIAAQMRRNNIDLYYGPACFESLQMPIIPRSMVVVGAGIIGCEYSSIFATLGTEVSLVDWRDQPLGFADRESVNALIYHNPSCLL